jgi:dTDP-4-dehydrorhamnose 3,5-epimerase
VSDPTTSGAASAIRGVRWGAVARHADVRGSFRELWRAGWFTGPAGIGESVTLGESATIGIGESARIGGPVGAAEAAAVAPEPRFAQANLSNSAPGVLRGLHFHRRQLDYWVVADGRAWVALVDARPLLDGSGDRPIVETRELAADATVTIPAGVAHGFLALEQLSLVYLVTAEYDATDELGFAWDDPLAAIPWPDVPGQANGRPILSGRDLANPSLLALVERIRSE